MLFVARLFCIAYTHSREICTTCCADETEAECKSLDNNDWEFYLSTVFFVVLCCCFSALCGFTEARRKQKGISFAAAWSIPQAMPVLRTWPRRSVSVSDAMNGLERDESGWAPLSDDENDQKKYPVAGLVDDTGMAFGFVTSMPQSVLGSVSASLRRQNPAATAAPISPREPELTVWISRDGEPTPYPTNTGVHQAESHGGRNRVETSTSSTRRDDGAQNSGGGTRYSVANNLHEPLIFGDGVIGRGAAADGTRNGDRDGVEEGKSAEGIEVGGER